MIQVRDASGKLVKRVEDCSLARGIVKDGKRLFYPYRIHLEVQLSVLSITSTTLIFYAYTKDDPEKGVADEAVQAAFAMMDHFYKTQVGIAKNEWPKPTGLGTARVLTDKEYEMDFQQARREGREVRTAGDKNNPMGWHCKAAALIISLSR